MRIVVSVVGSLAAAVLPATLLVAPPVAATATAPELGRGSVLFIDNHRVESFDRVRRVYFPGRKVVISPERPGQVSIKPVTTYPVQTNPLVGPRQENVWRDKQVDGHRDIDSNALFGVASVIADRRASGAVFYRMYLRSGGNVGYRESSDGVQWRPLADPDKLVIVPRLQPMSVFRDARARQYVLVGWRRGEKNLLGGWRIPPGYVVMRSSNGIDFTEVSHSGGLASLTGDVIHAATDPLTGRKLALAKRKVHAGPSCGSGVAAGGRAFTTVGALDLSTWSAPGRAVASDCVDALSVPPGEGTNRPMQVYGAPFTRYGDQFVSFPWLFRVTRHDAENPGHSDGPIDSQVASTPAPGAMPWRRSDANRVVNGRKVRPVLIRRGPAGSWDDGMIFAAAPIINFGGRSHVYYTGWNATHKPVDGRRARPGMASWRRDGFVGLRPTSSRVAEVRTKAFTLTSGATRELRVNASLASGSMTVGVVDAQTGAWVPGFGPEASNVLRSDRLDQIVRWRGQRLGALHGRPIKLVFRMVGESSTFYAFRVN